MHTVEELRNIKEIPKTVNGFIIMLLMRHKVAFILSCIGCLAVAIEHTAFPYVTKLLIDGLNVYKDGSIFTHLKFPLTLGAIIWVGNDALWRLAGYTTSYLRASLESFIKEYFTMHFISQNPTFFDKYQSGDLMGRTIHAAQEIPFMIEECLYFIMPCALNFIAILGLASSVDFRISICIFGWIITHMLICAYFAKKHMYFSKKYAKSINKFNAVIQDSTQNHVSIRSFSGFKIEKNIFRFFGNLQKRRQMGMLYTYQYMLVILTINCFVVNGIILTVIQLNLFAKGQMTVGDIAMILQLTSSFIVLVFETTMLFGEIIQTYGVIRQNYTVMSDVKYSEKSNKELNITSGSMEIKNLSFRYDEDYDYLFHNFNLSIKPMEKIGIVGRSGSGKTTLIGLIMKHFENFAGDVSIDGHSIRDIHRDVIMKYISHIPQQPILFNRSIFENIRYGKLDATDEEVMEAAKFAQIHDEIMNMPGNYYMYVGELGTEMSHGQRQRIAIARAVLKNSPILILDEATSALDAETEKKIKESLEVMMENKTVIIVAHKLSTVLSLDRIIILQSGKIIEDGNPRQLAEKDGSIFKQMIDTHIGDLIEE